MKKSNQELMDEATKVADTWEKELSAKYKDTNIYVSVAHGYLSAKSKNPKVFIRVSVINNDVAYKEIPNKIEGFSVQKRNCIAEALTKN